MSVDNKGDSQVLAVSIRGWIALILVLTVCGMSAYGLTVNEPLYTLSTIAVGFYFGQNAKSGGGGRGGNNNDQTQTFNR
jgi:hypothetical protein